jgi:hypothetical protein
MRSRRSTSLLLAALFLLGGLIAFTPRPAQAISNEKAWRYGTYAAGASTIYAFSKRKGTWGLVGAAGTYLAYRKWQAAKNRRRANDRRRWSTRRYSSSRYSRRYR